MNTFHNDDERTSWPRRRLRSCAARTLTTAAFSCLLLGSGLADTVPTGAQTDPLAAKSDQFLRKSVADARQKGPDSQAIWGWSTVIVRLDGELTPEKEMALKALDADIYRHLGFIQSVAARVPTRNLAKLARLAFVQRISADVQTRRFDEFTVRSSMADAAWAQFGVSGSGVGVAVLDSGVNYLHPDLLDTNTLNSRLAASVSFVNDGYGITDRCGHGTHVAGIIAGNGLMSSGYLYTHTYYGIARRANIISVRVLDGVGQSSVSTVLAGIQWVIANRTKYNIRVMNLSLGHPVGESYTTDPLCQAVEQAWNSGIFVVCAAGNGGRLNATQTPGSDNEGWGTANGSIQSPANDPFVITVGAMKSVDGNRAHDRLATYSSRGPSRLDMVMKPDIVAPGNQIVSLEAWNSTLDTVFSGTNLIPWQMYCKLPLSGNSLAYFRLSGTSMAAPVVAGAAALMLEKDPTLTPDMIKARLMISADKWKDPDGNYKPWAYGAGYLNIPAALKSGARVSAHATSPSLSRDDQGHVVINRQNIIWGTSTIWGLDPSSATTSGGTDTSGGTSGGTTPTPTPAPTPPPPDNIIIWGNNFADMSDVLSASNIIWGSTVWSDNVIWGMSFSSVDLTSAAIYGE